MAPRTRPMTTAVNDYDRAKIDEAAKITSRNYSEFLRLAATETADKIIAEHKRAKRAKRRNEDD